ncbi:hypothetical protein LEP1GSC188_3857 [Leptospira weilii serovar Topaz str. LT2116]|uniref:Uncharacterized protein n=1 Tax=Leptospira weilii serovar Topaz str. LT2116 TaxID=1088540 RepID=M3GUF0_9LEPT|nr:hypothetical protein LEP1GSC188_3857 [Leptospira weilii serovar Topaz str. LT2116]
MKFRVVPKRRNNHRDFDKTGWLPDKHYKLSQKYLRMIEFGVLNKDKVFLR